MSSSKLRPTIYGSFVLAALVVLIDFLLPGQIIDDHVLEIQKERQQYYNAAGNYHYSYKVVTGQDRILVSEDFAQTAQAGNPVRYSVSRIFKEINWYKLSSSENRSFYSLRLASGLVLPLLLILSIFITVRYKKKLGTLVFILQTLFIGDLILLMT